MQVKWLVEDDAFPTDTMPFVEAIRKQGMQVKLIDQKPYTTPEFLDFPPEDCVVFYGSLGLAKKLIKKAKWIPGAYYNVPKYSCVNYYAALGKYLLNGNYIMLPYGELIRQKEFLYEHLSQDRAVFIRPNRGDKVFTGQIVLKENYEKDIGFYNIEPQELVVVSEPRNVLFEWRFVIVEGKVIAGSQYKEGIKFSPEETYPQEAADFATEIAAHYNPDPAFVVDVCSIKSGLFLMEVGCFSCAGLYNCNRDVIASRVSELALKEWQSYEVP
jgi:hypothetical protein